MNIGNTLTADFLRDLLIGNAQQEAKQRHSAELVRTPAGLRELDEWSQWSVDCHDDLARAFRNIESACIELAHLPEQQTRALTGMFQAVLALHGRCLRDADTMD